MQYKNSAEKMIKEGLCKNCDGKPAECLRLGQCRGDVPDIGKKKNKKFFKSRFTK